MNDLLLVIDMCRFSGWLALGFLLAAICMTPIARIAALFGFALAARIKPVRRAFGITSACFALPHAAYSFFALLHARTELFEWPHLRAGALALLVLCLLLLTSFPALVTHLRIRTWKELHRLAYVAAWLVLVHVLTSPFASRPLVLALYAGVVLLELARLLPQRAAQAQISSGIPASTQKRSSTSQ